MHTVRYKVNTATTNIPHEDANLLLVHAVLRWTRVVCKIYKEMEPTDNFLDSSGFVAEFDVLH